MGQVQSSWQVFIVYGVVYALGNSATSIAPVVVMVSQWFVERRGVATSVAVSGNAIGQLFIVAGTGLAAGCHRMAVVLHHPCRSELCDTVAGDPPGGAFQATGNNGPGRRNAWRRGRAPNPSPCGKPSPRGPSSCWWASTPSAASRTFFVATHIVAFAQDQGMGDVLAGNLLAWMGVMGLIGVLVAGGDGRRLGRLTPHGAVLRDADRHLRPDTAGRRTPRPSWPSALLYGFTFLITAPVDGGVPRQHLRAAPPGNADRHGSR